MPRNSAVTPPTVVASLVLSVMSSRAALPRCDMTALMDSMALRVSSWYLSRAARRLTSSFSRFSLMRPSASASARSRCTCFCRSAAYCSAALLSAWICCSMRRRSASCRADASSCSLAISALRCRCSSCSAIMRLRASSSSYCFMRADTCARCSSSCRSSWYRTCSRSLFSCAVWRRNSASLSLDSCCLVISCCLVMSNTCFA
mmetsp:Transcript_14544/g.31663  ORF Transcript_14544/g.31663 Transcript_14544/m.31663 type:complete len:203 (+) Transcript_14544:1913-2521(+)